jgi:ParB/RepB/Spo0J family partition protein
VSNLPLNVLDPAPDNIRTDLGDLTELASSIASLGILEPLVVTTAENGRYQVVCGARRLAAAIAVGLESVPVVVREFSESERLEAMLIENLQRADVSAEEEARAYQRLIDAGLTQRQLSERVGRSQSHISKRLALLDLPPAARSSLDSGRITIDDALALTKLKEHPAQIKEILADKYLDAGEIGYEVNRRLDDIKAEQKSEKARAELEEKGITVVKWEKATNPTSKMKMITARYGAADLALDVRKHAKEPCHAATVGKNFDAGKVFYVCTDPARHTKAGASTLKAKTSPARVGDSYAAKQRAEAKLRKEAGAARSAVLSQILQGKIATKDALEHAGWALLEELSTDLARVTCELLEIPAKTKEKYPNYPKWVRTYAAKSPAQFLEAVVAAAFAVPESHLRTAYRSWTGTDVARHFALLKARGYEPTAFETKQLKAAAKKRTDDEAIHALHDDREDES